MQKKVTANVVTFSLRMTNAESYELFCLFHPKIVIYDGMFMLRECVLGLFK